MVTIVIILFLIIGALLLYIQRKDNQHTTLHEVRIRTSENFLRTVAAGVLHRFAPELQDEQTSQLFLTEKNVDFISFAAQIIQRTEGGTIYLTHHSTYGHPHFELERADGTYVGMAIVQQEDVTYETIALLHSHLIHQQAQGGYVVTTSDFTPSAFEYAENLEIELINGIQLATSWIQMMDHKRYEKDQTSRSNRAD